MLAYTRTSCNANTSSYGSMRSNTDVMGYLDLVVQLDSVLYNGIFNRTPVHVLHEDRLNVVLANDGSVGPGRFVAQGSGASLNRVLKAQAA